jgi:hypothetical protein
MNRGRLTIGSLLGAIIFFGIIFAGLRSGSNDWFKSIYTLTFVTLVFSAIAARYRGAFWYGFAVAGWAYFIVGFGPWIGAPPGSEPLQAVNRNIVTSVVLEFVSGTMSMLDPRPQPGAGGPVANLVFQPQWSNRDGICHSVLTIFSALLGGLVSKRLARRPSPAH